MICVWIQFSIRLLLQNIKYFYDFICHLRETLNIKMSS